jgi:hypothetical protein
MTSLIQSPTYNSCREKLLSLHGARETLGIWTAVESHDKTLLRNFLAFRLALIHAGRAGRLANVTLEEFEQRRFNDDTGNFEAAVFKHKTTMTGPQRIFLTDEDEKMVRAYFSCVRSGFFFRHLMCEAFCFLIP